jgi:hypothetical protein
MGVGGQHHAPAAFTPGKDPVPTVQEKLTADVRKTKDIALTSRASGSS